MFTNNGVKIMVYVKDEKIQSLSLEQQNLMRQIDKLGSKPEKDSSFNDLNKRLENVKEALKVRRYEIIEELKCKIEEEENKMPEEPKVEETKIGRKTKEGTLAAAIEKTLLLKSVSNIDAAVTKVVELMPNKEPAKVKSQIKNIIRAVVKGQQKRWQKYTWDKESFSLVEK